VRWTPSRPAKPCTAAEFPYGCPFRGCRRNRRCSTTEVICRQILRDELNAIILPALRARRDGGSMPVRPASREAWEALFADRWPDSPAADKLDGGE
jgi:hypothetical protein